MSRRPRQASQFGSDSFLDIVCNVVGILIILMVVVGVRASRVPTLLSTALVDTDSMTKTIAITDHTTAPDALPLPASPDPTPAELDFPVMSEDERSEPVVTALPEPEPEPSEPVAAAEPEPPTGPTEVVLPAELIAAAQKLQTELTDVDRADDRIRQQLEEAQRQEAKLRQRMQAIEKQQSDQQSQLDVTRRRRSTTAAELEHLRQLIAELSRALQQQMAESPNAKRLEHRITPIGQVVTGQELHFRVLNDRVSVVPLEPLINRLRNQIDRHKDWLAKSRQQLGQVGPIEGYTMHYVVERESGSVVDELRMGPGVFRISVTEWRLEAERSVKSESAQEALRPGSHFASAVAAAPPGSTLTFWVYPDSFRAYGELKEFCQQQNFMIAGRPLPTGIPIAGSPTGTRSTGQ